VGDDTGAPATPADRASASTVPVAEAVADPGTRPGGGVHAHRRSEPRFTPRWVALTWVLAGLGVGLRIRQYVFHRSLWNDEAALALNVLVRGYSGLTRPLAIAQGAPIGFLWLEKSATEVFGSGEYALRLMPLLAGVASVVVFRSLVARVLHPLAACTALTLFAVSPALVYYASESKQYGVDVAAAVGLAWFVPWLLDAPLTVRRCLVWASVASVAVWVSFPAAFVAGGVSLVVLVMQVRRRSWDHLWAFALACAAWGAAFLVEYVVSLRRLHSTPALLRYWTFAFAPRPLRLGSASSWLWHDARAVIAFPWDLRIVPLAAVLLGVGLAALLWRRPPVGMLVASVGAVAAVAGVVHAYPVADRMVLFTLPFVCLTLGGVVLVSRRVGVQLACVALVAAVAAGGFGSAASAVVHPYTRTEVREAYVTVLQHREPGDAVLVEWEGVPDFFYYHLTLGVDAQGTVKLGGSAIPCDNAAQLSQLLQWRRVWLVFAIDPDSEQGHPIAHYLAAFHSVGTVVAATYTAGPAAAVLLRIRPALVPPDPTVAAPPWQPAPYGCVTVHLSSLADGIVDLGNG
jgi:hypothetical protein